MTLADYIAQYALAHDLAPGSIEQLWHAVRALDAWQGHPTHLIELSDELLNRWITARLEAKKSRRTVRGQRGSILTLWRAAHEGGLLENGPGCVKVVRIPHTNPNAWWPDEMARLLRAAEQAPGRFKLGCRRCDMLTAFLLVGYYSMLRQCDLLKLRKADVRADGRILITQQKTGDLVEGSLLPDAMEALRRIETDSEYLFPLRKKTLNYWWGWLKKQARVPGTQKWLRRTGATQCEIRQPGSAQHALGHRTPGLAYRSYIDARQLPQRTATPPRIV